MVKVLDAPWKYGQRVGEWLKVKPEYFTVQVGRWADAVRELLGCYACARAQALVLAPCMQSRSLGCNGAGEMGGRRGAVLLPSAAALTCYLQGALPRSLGQRSEGESWGGRAPHTRDGEALIHHDPFHDLSVQTSAE